MERIARNERKKTSRNCCIETSQLVFKEMFHIIHVTSTFSRFYNHMNKKLNIVIFAFYNLNKMLWNVKTVYI